MEKPVKEDGTLLFLETILRQSSGREPEHENSHTSDAIYASEARGQKQFVASESLPTNVNGYRPRDSKLCVDADLEEMGIELGEPFEDDEVFRPAKLPEGWTREGTDHSMWSNILDEQGHIRLNIFYKAAFYDRSAHVSPCFRFGITSGRDFRWRTTPEDELDYDAKESGDSDVVVIDRATKVLIELARFEVPPEEAEYGTEEWAVWNEAKNAAHDLANAWLDEHYPDWCSPAAHWND